MSSDPEASKIAQLNTSGGAVVDGSVNTGGGDFVGRDQIITEEVAYNVHGLTNPYLGLRAFGYTDRTIYAGREQLAHETIQRLTTPVAQQTLIFITGASGSGKSSFAQAGLIPLLEHHYAAYHKTLRHAIFRPSSQPMVMLADALQKLHPDLTPETLATKTPKDQINLLLIDQFEELFIQSDASQRPPFCDFLTNLPSFAEGRTHVLITLRVDYLDELFAIQPLWAIAKEGVELRTMKADDLRNAIQKPLQVHYPQKRFAPELLDRLQQDAGEDAALLPLLQVTLAELWKTGKLVLSNYHSLTNAIRQRAEAVYAFSDHANADPKTPRSTADQQELMGILLDLINVSVDGDDRRDVRQRRTRHELEQGSTQRPRLIEELVNARLLAAASETHNGEDVEVIDIIHESLIDNWDRLRQAIEEQRQQLQRRARFKLWLGEWVRNGRQDGYLLLTDMQLTEAQVLMESQDIEIQDEEARKFYQRSGELQEAKYQKELHQVRELAETQRQKAEAERKRAQIFRSALLMISTLMLIATIAGVISIYLNARLSDANTKLRITSAEAQHLAQIARIRQLTAQSELLKDSNYPASLLLAAEAVTTIRSTESPQPIPSALTALHDRLEGQPGGLPLTGHEDDIKSVASSEDGVWLASGSFDHTLRVWKIGEWNSTPIILRGHESGIESVAFSSTGEWLASGGWDKSIRVWRVGKWEAEPDVLRGHTDVILSLAFSKDGTWLASSSLDNSIRIWRVGEWEAEPIMLHGGQDDSFSSIAFSEDGVWLAVSSGNSYALPGSSHVVYIWRVGKWETEPIILRGHEDDVLSVAFNKNGTWLASGSRDRSVRIWKVGEWEAEPIVLNGHQFSVSSVAFSKDGTLLASASRDKTVRIWDVGVWESEPVILRGHDGAVESVVFNANGEWLISGSQDKSLRVWKVKEWHREPVVLRKHENVVSSVTFSLDRLWLASGSWDKTIQVWSVGDWQSEPPVILRGYEGGVSSVAFSFDGMWLAGGSLDKTVRVWKVGKWAIEPIILRGFEDGVNSIAFSPDGVWLAGGSNDKTIRIWRVGEWQPDPIILPDNENRILSVAFSEDSAFLASGSVDNTLRIWQVGKWMTAPIYVGKFDTAVNPVVFSRDGMWMASGSWDDTLRLWHVGEWETEPMMLRGHADDINSLAFSADGKLLASASWDKTVRIWTISIESLLQRACLLTGRNLTLNEWLVYLGSIDGYRPTCPDILIPEDVIVAIKAKAVRDIRIDQVLNATQRLDQLNGWLRVNGQFKNYGIDIEAFVAEIAGTAPSEASPSQTSAPEPIPAPMP